MHDLLVRLQGVEVDAVGALPLVKLEYALWIDPVGAPGQLAQMTTLSIIHNLECAGDIPVILPVIIGWEGYGMVCAGNAAGGSTANVVLQEALGSGKTNVRAILGEGVVVVQGGQGGGDGKILPASNPGQAIVSACSQCHLELTSAAAQQCGGARHSDGADEITLGEGQILGGSAKVVRTPAGKNSVLDIGHGSEVVAPAINSHLKGVGVGGYGLHGDFKVGQVVHQVCGAAAGGAKAVGGAGLERHGQGHGGMAWRRLAEIVAGDGNGDVAAIDKAAGEVAGTASSHIVGARVAVGVVGGDIDGDIGNGRCAVLAEGDGDGATAASGSLHGFDLHRGQLRQGCC